MSDFFINRSTLLGRIYSIFLNQRLFLYSYSGKGIFLARGSRIGSRKVCIGRGTRINGAIVIKGSGEVVIGRYCAIGDGVRIVSDNHDMHVPCIQLALQKRITGSVFCKGKGVIKIGHDVWIGDAAIILPGVEVGNGAVIAAGAIVTKNIPPYSVVAGVPAKQVGERCSSVLAEKLNNIEWWNWDEKEMRNNKAFFMPWKGEKEMLTRIQQKLGNAP